MEFPRVTDVAFFISLILLNSHMKLHATDSFFMKET